MQGVIVGKVSQASVAGLEVTTDEYEIDPATDDIQDKSTTARGRVRHSGGFSERKGSLKGYFDPTNNPQQATARNLRAGSVLTNLLLQLHPTAGGGLLRFLMPSVVVESAKVTDVAEKRADFEMSWVVDGQMYYPGSGTLE